MPTIEKSESVWSSLANGKQADDMAWPTPQFSKSMVNKAGQFLANPEAVHFDVMWAYEVLTNWRACHGYPINTFQATLRRRLEQIDIEAIVGQRLKRAPSIIDKLRRFPNMKLSQMQDIGGLRAILSSVSNANMLRNAYRLNRFKHELVSEYDYIVSPKKDGYRSIHLVFRYVNDSVPEYNGLRIELQIRTKLQHAWATAVETMSTFLGQKLKASQGERKWHQFFEVTSSAFAHLEKCAAVPGHEKLSRRDIFGQVRDIERDLAILDKLDAFRHAVRLIAEMRQGSFHLVILDSTDKTVMVEPYSMRDLNQAITDYAAAEERAANGDKIEAVLVSGASVNDLRRAFPNYFLDTEDFSRQVTAIVSAAQS